MHIRKIEVGDDVQLGKIVRNTLEEFGANLPGTVYYDAETDHLSAVFLKEGSCYFVVEQDGVVFGGAGIYPSPGLEDDTVELVKMYLSPAARGLGLGKQLIEKCFTKARSVGYTKMYIETMPPMKKAISIYESLGFTHLSHPLGGC